MTGLAPIMHRNSEKLMTPSPFLSTTFIISSASSMLHTCTTMAACQYCVFSQKFCPRNAVLVILLSVSLTCDSTNFISSAVMQPVSSLLNTRNVSLKLS